MSTTSISRRSPVMLTFASVDHYMLDIRKHLQFDHYIAELRTPENIVIHEQRFESLADACGFAEGFAGGTFQIAL